jgi:hypothetical protein
MFSRLRSGERVALPTSEATVRVHHLPFAFVLLVVCLLVPATARAVTVDQVVALSKAGVSEAVIIALLDRDGTVFSIQPEQIAALKREGLSDTLIVAMLRNGREQGEEAARAVAEDKAASILATLPVSSFVPSPDLVIVGHGPERPDTGYSSTGFRSSRSRRVYEPSLPFVPYGPALPYDPPFTQRFNTPYAESYGQRLFGVAQVNTARGPGLSYVTECPAVMQPTLRPR